MLPQGHLRRYDLRCALRPRPPHSKDPRPPEGHLALFIAEVPIEFWRRIIVMLINVAMMRAAGNLPISGPCGYDWPHRQFRPERTIVLSKGYTLNCHSCTPQKARSVKLVCDRIREFCIMQACDKPG